MSDVRVLNDFELDLVAGGPTGNDQVAGNIAAGVAGSLIAASIIAAPGVWVAAIVINALFVSDAY